MSRPVRDRRFQPDNLPCRIYGIVRNEVSTKTGADRLEFFVEYRLYYIGIIAFAVLGFKP